MKKIFYPLIWTKWKAVRSYWPYKEGWGTYKKHRWSDRRVILDTGLSKEYAKHCAEQLNRLTPDEAFGRMTTYSTMIMISLALFFVLLEKCNNHEHHRTKDKGRPAYKSPLIVNSGGVQRM